MRRNRLRVSFLVLENTNSRTLMVTIAFVGIGNQGLIELKRLSTSYANLYKHGQGAPSRMIFTSSMSIDTSVISRRG